VSMVGSPETAVCCLDDTPLLCKLHVSTSLDVSAVR
jgi:hypothetical protein